MPTTGTSRTVDLGGPTHYLDFGGPAGGPLLLAVHGLGGSAWNWLAVAPLFTTRCRLLAVDLAGHGQSPAAGRSTTVTANRRLLDRFIREIVDEPLILMGNSMGGLIALLEAAKSPELTRAVILIDPAVPRPFLSKVDPRVALQFAVVALPGIGGAAIARRTKRMSTARQVQETLSLCTVDVSRVPQSVIDETIRAIDARDPKDFSPSDVVAASRSLMRMLSRPQPLRRTFHTITAPVLILHGARDRLVSLDVARTFARDFPEWRFEVADDIGHVPMLEAPEWTAQQVLRWLETDASALEP
jgi:pimeloyl-ACP methyl ester carboxylesterase